MPAENFDLESVYDAEIAPLMTKILEICKREKMPMVASFEYRHADGDEDVCTSHLHWPNRSPDCFMAARRLIYARREPPFLAMTITKTGGADDR